MTRVTTLWHHHQPDYREPSTGRPLMPWVRLHALRGYRDLAVALLESGCPMTVNLVPSLIDQLAWYEAGGDDPHLALTRKEAAALRPEERAEVLESFVAGHPAMFEAHPAAARLRGLRDAGALSSVQDLRDLQVWSTLVWVGWSGRRDAPELQDLIRRGQGFTEDDKATMLRACARLVREVMPLYRTLARRGGELSASAYYHPILPLLVDLRCARRNLPHLRDQPLPPFAHPEDAAEQLLRGRMRVEQATGAMVQGLWPSEGSVSPELLPLAARAGFRWLVSDEEVLRRSEHSPLAAPGAMELGEGLVGFFRDRAVSDAIGFRFSRMRSTDAVDDLIGMLHARRGTVTIALDGENPWESFPDAGEDFMRRMMDRLTHDKALTPLHFAEAAAERPAGRVRALHTGSWINADFRIWAGDEEDIAAWRLLSETRLAVAAAGNPPEAMEAVYAAEGSDWFWWYGEQFSTPFARQFDALFRAHLRRAWEAIGRPPPAALEVSVLRAASVRASVRAASRRVDANDVDPTDYFAWAGAGELRFGVAGGSMARGATHLDRVRWSWQDGMLLLRMYEVSPAPPEPPGSTWHLYMTHGGHHRICSWPYADADEANLGVRRWPGVTELRVPAAEEPRFHLELARPDGEATRYPEHGGILAEAAPTSWWI